MPTSELASKTHSVMYYKPVLHGKTLGKSGSLQSDGYCCSAISTLAALGCFHVPVTTVPVEDSLREPRFVLERGSRAATLTFTVLHASLFHTVLHVVLTTNR